MFEPARHISSSFDAALYGLKNDVLMMSSLTDRNLQIAFDALLKRDNELSEQVINEVDLIFVSRAIERIGDHATSIAEDSFWREQASDIRHTYRPGHSLTL